MVVQDTFRLLQYNIRKSKDTVAAPLLADPRTRQFHILAIQEPWNNPFVQTSYNPSSSNFWLSAQEVQTARVAFYISKDISLSSWTVRHISPDLAVLNIQIQFQDEVRDIQIYNVYNPPPYSLYDSTGPTTLRDLKQDLISYPNEYTIVLGDFNLHHPIWNSRSRLTQHAYADFLIDIMDEFKFQLLTPQGLETWSARDTNSTIDLTFATSFLSEALVKCDLEQDLDHQSDHLPICTEFGLHVTYQKPVPRRAWKRLNEELLLQSLRSNPVFSTEVIAELYTKEQIDQEVSRIHAAFLDAIDLSVPWSKPCQFSQGFWTQQCTETTLRARYLRRQAPNSDEYRAAIQAKKKTVQKAKIVHFRTQVQAATETSGIWRLAKWARTKSHLPPPIPQCPTLVTPEGQLATSFEEKE